jgi:hypothetical protein
MDFSSYANTFEDPIDSTAEVRVLKPRIEMSPYSIHSNLKLKPHHPRNKRILKVESIGLEIFHIKDSKNEDFSLSLQGPSYLHVYKEDKFIEQALFSLRTSKRSKNSQGCYVKIPEQGLFLPSQQGKRSPNQARLSSSRQFKSSQRSQTAEAVREPSPVRSSFRQKEAKFVKRELLPQTKASLASKLKLNLESLNVRGTIKDFAIRQLGRSRGWSQSPR